MKTQFRVVEGPDGGAILVMNSAMKTALTVLLDELEDRSIMETALMHELRECGSKPRVAPVSNREVVGAKR